MKRTLLAIVATLGMIGCGDPAPTSPPGGTNTMTMNPQTQTFTCRAALQPSSFDYLVNGSNVTLTELTSGQPATFTQVSSSHGARSVYGVWNIPVTLDAAAKAAGLSLTATMEIAADHVTVSSLCSHGGKSTVAAATSSATVTDTEISILESKEDVKTLTF